MKLTHSMLVFFCCVFILQQAFGQLACSIHTYVFEDEESSYIENYVGIQSKTVAFVQDAGTVQYLVSITQGESIIYAEKYAISIREEDKLVDLWDVKRYGLKPGDYLLSINLIDVHTQDTVDYSLDLSITKYDVAHVTKPMLCSKIQKEGSLPFEKYGLQYEKLGYDLVGEEQDKLFFFNEVYNTALIDPELYLLRYSISQGFYNPSMSGDYIKQGFIKKTSSDKDVITKAIDITDILTGSYHLLVELIDKEQVVHATNHANFQVLRPQKDIELLSSQDESFETSFVQDMNENQLKYALKAIAPRISGQRAEILNAVLQDDNIKTKRYFVYAFWKEYSADYPKEAYDKYMKVAEAVHNKYDNNVGYGFETDRGFYFLKYGKPDQIIVEDHEPSAPPYEIWIYNQIQTGETNVKFLFYNPSLSFNDFVILHSNCNSDIRNPQWQLQLYGDSPNENQGNAIDATSVGDNFGRNAVRYMNDN